MTREEDYQLSRSMRKEPIEDTFVHATRAQIEYIETLRKSLAYSLTTFCTKVSQILHKQFIEIDVWSLSRSEASQVIDKFKQWKEERK